MASVSRMEADPSSHEKLCICRVTNQRGGMRPPAPEQHFSPNRLQRWGPSGLDDACCNSYSPLYALPIDTAVKDSSHLSHHTS